MTRNSRVAYANLTYTEGVVQVGSVADAITELGQAGKTHVTNLADDEKTYTDTADPIIGARTLLYTEADNDLRKAITTADNVWRNNTAQAWGTHTAGDLVARGNVRRTLANTSLLVADASQASIAEHKALWWQNEIPNYLQWSVDIGGIETAYTNSTTANILLRATGIKTAGVAYASTVGTAIQTYETTTVTAREHYLSTLMNVSETAAEATLRADRDKEIAVADADLQKQLTGNESAHATSVNNANSAHSTATANAEAARKSAEQAALTQLNSTLAQATKDREASIAGAERTYDQVVASLDAQYGSESSNGDTGVEGATRRSAIKTRDAQYYAARDTSWANTLSGSTTLGTSPWTVKAISAANAQAAYSTSRASAQAAHDAAMLDAIEDWQHSSRESLTDLLFTEGQSRETYNVATSNVYANWENGVANLLGDKPEGTGWEGNAIVTGSVASDSIGSHRELRFGYFFDETVDSESSDIDEQRSALPKLPRLGENGSKVFPSYYPSFSTADYTDAEMVAYRTGLRENIAFLKQAINEVRARIAGINYATGSRGAIHLPESEKTKYVAERKTLSAILEKLNGQLSAALATEHDLVHTVNEGRKELFWATADRQSSSRRGLPPGLLLEPSELDANVTYYQTQIAIEVLTLGLGKLAHLRHLSKASLAAKANQEVIEHVDELVKLMDNAPVKGVGLLDDAAGALVPIRRGDGLRHIIGIRRSYEASGDILSARKNIAYAEINTTAFQGELRAISGETARAGFVSPSNIRLFRTREAGGFFRGFDSETHLLEDLAKRLSPDSFGTVRLFSERPVCAGCQDVIKQFQQMFPKIKIVVSGGVL